MGVETMTATAKYDRLPGWFATFCDPFGGVRYPGIVAPWVDPADGFIYATDGRAIVRVHSSLVAEEAWPATRDGRGPIRQVPANPGRDIYGMRPGDEWEDEPLPLPADVGPWKLPCPECHGRPTEPHPFVCDLCDGDGVDICDDDSRCPSCDGKGSVTITTCPACDEAGVMVVWEAVEIPGRSDGLTLSVANVRRVLDAGGLIYARKGADSATSALKFTVGEDFEGRLMPVRRGGV
jgi:hypothetical protein